MHSRGSEVCQRGCCRCTGDTSQWRHNGHCGVSNHRRLHCLLNCWFRRRSKKTSKLHVTGVCVGNSPVTGEFPAQKASDAENVSMTSSWVNEYCTKSCCLSSYHHACPVWGFWYSASSRHMMMSWHGIFFRVTGPLRGETTGYWWIPSQRACNASFDVFSDVRLNNLFVLNKQWTR